MSKPHILYVEDDETLGFVTKDNLELKGYRVSHFCNGTDALTRINREQFDIAILDIMLPEVDGFHIAQQLRSRDRQMPILFLSAKSLKEDRLKGFSLGADDYITKPFSIEELEFKIQIFLKRRKIVDGNQGDKFIISSYTFDYPNLSLWQKEQERKVLTQKEADVLKFLAERRNQVIKRSLILEQIWGEDDYFMGRSLDVFISRLRKYLADDSKVQIENIHGVGFKLRIHEA